MCPQALIRPSLCAAIFLSACVDGPTPTATLGPPSFITNGSPTGAAFGNVGALLFDFDRDGTIEGGELICSGGLISPTVFLTAAHCVAGAPPSTVLWVSFDPDLLPAPSPVIRAVSFHFDPAFGHDQADLHDLAVVILPSGSTAGIEPLQLPTAGLLDRRAAQGGLVGQLFLNVGYGVSGSVTGRPAFTYDGNRNMSKAEFVALQPSWLELLMNSNATDEGGDCFGDSGGPKFFDGNTRLIVATVTKGDPPCRATSFDYRLDTQSARAFLGQFVSLP
jgi:trypsin